MKFLQNLNRINVLFWLVSLLFVALTIWSVTFEIETSVNVEGEILPLGKTLKVQNRFEGKIREVLVSEGQQIDIGQKLVLFETDIDLSELKSIEGQIANLLVRIDRLNHQMDRKVLFENKPEYEAIIYDEQKALLVNEISDLDSDLLALGSEKDVKNSNLQALQAEIGSLNQEIRIAKSQYELAKDLYEKGYEGQISLMEKESEVLKKLNLLSDNKSKIDITMKEIQLIDIKMDATVSEFLKTTSRLLVESREEMRSLSVQKDAAKARISEFFIQSPAAGLVSTLMVTTPGQVLEPGAVVLEIIPDDQPLVFYAKVPVQYINDISIGQNTLVIPSTFDTRKQKPLDGVIEKIASDSTIVDDQAPHYEVVIKMKSESSRDNSSEIRAGVTGSSSIITGKRTVLDYVLEPILLSLRGVMSET